MDFNLRLANTEDEELLRQLLQQSQLSEEGIRDENSFYLIAEDINGEKKRVLAIAGIEKRESYGLLKSLILETKLIPRTEGVEFITNVVKFAKRLRLNELYLLTLPNSKMVFELLNFRTISFEELPNEIKASKHFMDSYRESVIIMKSY